MGPGTFRTRQCAQSVPQPEVRVGKEDGVGWGLRGQGYQRSQAASRTSMRSAAVRSPVTGARTPTSSRGTGGRRTGCGSCSGALPPAFLWIEAVVPLSKTQVGPAGLLFWSVPPSNSLSQCNHLPNPAQRWPFCGTRWAKFRSRRVPESAQGVSHSPYLHITLPDNSACNAARTAKQPANS